jgi:hypothetical protein
MALNRLPWPLEIVDRLNEYQQAGEYHPLTCGKNRTDEYHLDGEGVLVATPTGWRCPYCDYKQDFNGRIEGIVLGTLDDIREETV